MQQRTVRHKPWSSTAVSLHWTPRAFALGLVPPTACLGFQHVERVVRLPARGLLGWCAYSHAAYDKRKKVSCDHLDSFGRPSLPQPLPGLTFLWSCLAPCLQVVSPLQLPPGPRSSSDARPSSSLPSPPTSSITFLCTCNLHWLRVTYFQEDTFHCGTYVVSMSAPFPPFFRQPLPSHAPTIPPPFSPTTPQKMYGRYANRFVCSYIEHQIVGTSSK